MPGATPSKDVESDRIVLNLLESVERDGFQSQRRLAADLGIALGLVNAYLKRCVKKGLVKMSEAPARRYAYYLTPLGFAEKSRLTVDYLAYSFSFFRRAKADCSSVLKLAKARGFKRVVLAGQSDLAEIAALCALEHEIEIVGLVNSSASSERFVGLPVSSSFEAVAKPFDAVVITDLLGARDACEAAVARYGVQRVLMPELLRASIGQSQEIHS